MSRYVELWEMIQRRGTDGEAAAVGACPSAEPQPAEPFVDCAPVVARAAPVLPVDDDTRQVLSRLVHQLVCLPDDCRTLAFAALKSGNGCSWVISRIAEALALQCPGAVCLVDANSGSASLHTIFRVDNHQCGLADALASSDPLGRFVRQIEGNIWLMTAGSALQEGNAPLNSDLLRARLGQLRQRFAWVLIDAPPLDSVGDSLAVARAADGLVMVLEANVTGREAARKVREDLAAANVRVLGAVLNKRTFPIPRLLYKRL